MIASIREFSSSGSFSWHFRRQVGLWAIGLSGCGKAPFFRFETTLPGEDGDMPGVGWYAVKIDLFWKVEYSSVVT
jgi:hypothetical protein